MEAVTLSRFVCGLTRFKATSRVIPSRKEQRRSTYPALVAFSELASAAPVATSLVWSDSLQTFSTTGYRPFTSNSGHKGLLDAVKAASAQHRGNDGPRCLSVT